MASWQATKEFFMIRIRLFTMICCVILGGCSTGIDPRKYSDMTAPPDRFAVCHGYSCTSQTVTGFSNVEWKRVSKPFPAGTARDERHKIAAAIASMERIAGQKTGTDQDKGQAGMVKASTLQMDCIDETVNTTRYLEFLAKAGLLKFHEVAAPTHRGYLVDGRWPHNAAVIRDKATKILYVVDSFYRDNGQEPYIVLREDWLNGWKPPGARQ